MIKTSLKLTAVAAMLAGASVAANAATTDLGAVSGLVTNDVFRRCSRIRYKYQRYLHL